MNETGRGREDGELESGFDPLSIRSNFSRSVEEWIESTAPSTESGSGLKYSDTTEISCFLAGTHLKGFMFRRQGSLWLMNLSPTTIHITSF